MLTLTKNLSNIRDWLIQFNQKVSKLILCETLYSFFPLPFPSYRYNGGRKEQGIGLLITGVVLLLIEQFIPRDLRRVVDAVGGICVTLGVVLIVLSFI